MKHLAERRKSALNRLENQLKSGVKPTKDGNTTSLTNKDVKRISKEIDILKTRLGINVKPTKKEENVTEKA